MRKISSMLLAFVLFTTAQINAQVSSLVNPTYGYTFLNTTSTYTSLGAGGTVFQSGSAINTDGVSASIALPFTFTFNGIKENSIFISNNGFITFGIAPAASQYSPISSTTASGYNGVITGFGVNAVASTASGAAPEIRYGSNGGGDFVIQFQDLGQSAATGARVTFQIILKATTNVVEIVFGPNNVGFSGASQVQVGLRGTNQQDWNNRTLASGGNWNTAGGAAGTVAQAMSYTATTTVPASGRTFRWSPTAYAPTFLANAAGVVQEFTTWVNGSGPANVPTTNFATNGYGNASWQISNTTASTTGSGWTSTGGAYSPADYLSDANGRSARFHSFQANSPQVGYLDYYVDLSAITGTPTVDFYHINPSGTDILQVFLSTNGGASFTQIGSNFGVATSWTARSISLGATNSATTIIRFKATADFGNDDIGIDHLLVTPPATPPTITSFSPNNTTLCTGGNQTVTITGTNFTGTTSVTFNGVNAASFSVINATTINAVTPAAISAGIITVTNPAASANSAAYTLTALPTVTVLPASATYCTPGGTAISLSAGGASTYAWSPAGGLNATTGTPVSASPSSTTTYTVTGTDANGCVNTATSIITVALQPQNVTAVATPSTICNGDISNLTSSGFVPALANTLTFAGSAGSYVSLTGLTSPAPTVLTGATILGDDVGVGNLPIGFSFNYNGTQETVFGISSNGFIQLGNTSPTFTGFSGNALASTAKVIAPFWDDNNTTATTVQYRTAGSVGNRTLTVEWAGIKIGGSGSGTHTLNIEAILYEATGVVQFVYGTSTVGTGTISATIGISGASGNYRSVTPTSTSSPFATTSTATENTGISAFTNIPSGTTYTFTPPVALSYSWTNVTNLVSPSTQNTATTALTASETFTVVVSNGVCAAPGFPVSVTVSNGSVITTAPVATAKCVGETATFTVGASGAGLTYIWRKAGSPLSDGGNISGALTNTLTITNVSAADAANYDVEVSSTCGAPATSTPVALTVNPLPATVVANGAGTFCTSTTITATNGGDGTIYFQGTTTNGTSTATPSASEVISASGTYYFRAQSAAGCWGAEGSVAVVIQTDPLITGTPASICADASGTIAAVAANGCVNFTNSGTTINGTWTSATDPVALRLATSGMLNENTCAFDATITRNYVAQPFQVSVTGNYVFEMTNNAAYDGMGYIVTGAFTPGSCANGTFVRGDDDEGVAGDEPRLGSTGGDGAMTLTAGVTYTLISTTYSLTSGAINGTFAWTITPPGGGQIMLPSTGTIDWYTASSGGTSIGTGSPFNPVGVANSGLANTSTPGTTTFYAACSNASACRTAVNFVINANYDIVASSGANGAVTPAGTTTLSCDGTGDQTYTITPDPGYLISDLVVDGVSNTPLTTGSYLLGGTYDFTDVTVNHTISATFALAACINNTFSGTGNWSDNARWSCGAPPNSGDNVTIAASANATLDVDFTVAGSLVMNATSTLTVNPTRTLTVSGTADFAGQSVTFKSDNTGTASLGQVTGS
ncbi:MAG TPA: hypothetical protein PLZ68_19805, partial [Ferruginibacter sp.]|nr:hypothetical protein [Ferruginibacter sp.]